MTAFVRDERERPTSKKLHSLDRSVSLRLRLGIGRWLLRPGGDREKAEANRQAEPRAPTAEGGTQVALWDARGMEGSNA
jgi:hypothetical protein